MQSYRLPDLYRGRVCCDSREYIDHSEKFDRYFELWKTTEVRSSGYPLFLRLHHDVAKKLEDWLDFGPRAIDYVDLSLFTALALQWAALVFIFLSLRKFSGKATFVAFCILLSHPVIAGNAALPLSDVICGAWMTFSAGFVVRLLGGRSISRDAFLAGLFAGLAALTRPAVVVPSVIWVTLALLGACAIFSKTQKLRSVLLVVGFMIPISAPIASCWKKNHRIALSDPVIIDHQLRYAMSVALMGGQIATVWNPAPKIHAFIDPISKESLFDKCKLSQTPVKDWIECAFRHPLAMPLHLAKQAIALFDSFTINAYAVELSQTFDRWMNRLWGGVIFVCGWVGLGMFFDSAKAFIRRRRNPSREDTTTAIFAAYSVVSMALAILVHVETRYTFSFLPVFAFGGALAIDRVWPSLSPSKKSFFKYVAIGLAFAFLFQTFLWESAVDFSSVALSSS